MISTRLQQFIYRMIGKDVTQVVYDQNLDYQYAQARPMLQAEYASQYAYGAGQNGAFPPVSTVNVISPQVIWRGIFLDEAIQNDAWRRASLPDLDEHTT